MTIVFILVIADVVRRNLTGRAVPGAIEYAELALVGLIYLGLPHVQRSRQQIQVDAVINLLPKKVAQTADVVAMICFSLIVLWFLVGAADSALESFRQNEIRFGLARVAIWPARAAILVGFAATLVEVIVQFWTSLRTPGPHAPTELP